MLPLQLSIGSEPGQNPLGALHEYISRLRVNRRAGSGIALIDGVAQEIIVEPLPKFLAGLSIKASNPFLQIGIFTNVTHYVELAIGDDRGGLAGEVSHP